MDWPTTIAYWFVLVTTITGCVYRIAKEEAELLTLFFDTLLFVALYFIYQGLVR